MGVGTYILIGAGVLLFLILISNIVVVPQANEYVVELLGKYHATWTAGIHVKIPFFERIDHNCQTMRNLL